MVSKLDIAPRVTDAHGRAFANEWMHQSRETGAIFEAFARTGLIAWPGETDPDAMARYRAIEEEIVAALEEPVAETFVRVASRVLSRERRRRR